MNLVLNKNNNSRYLRKYDTVKKIGENSQKTPHSTNVSFTGAEKFIAKHAKHVTTYTNFDKIQSAIDGVLGEGFFSRAIVDAKLKSSIKDGALELKDSSLFNDIIKTLRYPFFEMWLDMINGATNYFKKFPKLKKLCTDVQNSKLIRDRNAATKREDSLQIVRNILETFANCSTDGDIERTTKNFMQKSADGITKFAKNYATRDERTLNRIATSTVSALYSAGDFYNITMLQKDDKKESRKASSGRFKQEMTRMAISAGLTFFTLGALDKYAKKDIKINAGIIAASALISEITSRILNKTPLRPLSPKEAAKIAENKNDKVQDNSKEQQKNNVNFKGNINPENLYKNFAQKDGTIASLNTLKEQTIKEAQLNSTKEKPKKSNTGLKIFGAIALAANILYFALKGKNGEFAAKMAKKDLYFGKNGIKGKEAIEEFLAGNVPELKGDVATALQKISDDQKEKIDGNFKFLKSIKTLITKRKETINLEELLENVKELRNKASDDRKPLLNQYIKDIETEIEKAVEKLKETMSEEDAKNAAKMLSVEVRRNIGSGVYEGVTRIINTIYQILTIPAISLNSIYNRIKFGKADKAFKELEKKLSLMGRGKPKDTLAELNRIIQSNTDKNAAIEQIFKNVRNIETKAETGELANLSRTMVTAISTYFFVNDYRNKVLIESGGKDIQKAKEETNDRIAHKAANFVINGTLMNLFNSVFKTQLNKSLVGATIIAASTEVTNEFMVRKSICQPILPKSSKKEILDYEEKQISKKGPFGAWSRFFRKITGKKTLTQKAGINTTTNSNNQKEDKKIS
ncbi:MAG: hypothetical protein IJ003_02160 [Candidatus Gastranaerophilales bacterium]|nr:hypothetical protein [Candidatus Gastranaerophilales bacterium]